MLNPRILFLVFVLLFEGCKLSGEKKESLFHEFYVGEWIQDSTSYSSVNSKIDFHPSKNFIKINSDSSITYFYYNKKRKQLFRNNYKQLVFTDSSMFDLMAFDENVRQPNWGKYKLEKINESSFKLIAMFETTGWSFPEEDSILYYSKIKNLDAKLDSLTVKNTSYVAAELKMNQLLGLWRWSETEKMSYTDREAKKYYLYIDTNKVLHTLWLGETPYHKRSDVKMYDDSFFYENRNSTIRLSSNDSLVLIDSTSSNYEARIYIKIKNDSVIPLKFRKELNITL